MPASESSVGHFKFEVSVVVPTYNYAHFLPHAIDSALQQELPASEILVIDDGSTDDTSKVVAARYGHLSQVRYIYQKNAGLSAARNTGIKAARFEYVAFLDADDQWLPGFLKAAAASFARLTDDFAVVASRGEFVGVDGAPLRLKRLLSGHSREITRAHILMRTRFSPSTVVARRSVFGECGDFDTSLRSSEDRDMWIRIASRKRIFLNGEILALIRRHSSSMSAHADRMKKNIRCVLNKARHDPESTPLSRFFWAQVFSFFRFQTAWMYYEENRLGAALRELMLSFLNWPWFLHPRHLNEPIFFRLRTLIRFLFRRHKARVTAEGN